MSTIILIIQYFSIFCTVIPIVFCGFKFKTFNKTLRVLFFYLVISLTTDLTSVFLALSGNTTNFIIGIFTYLEFLSITLIYFFEGESKYKTRYLLLIAAFSVYYLTVYLIIRNIIQITTWISVAETIIMIVFSLNFFFQLIDNKRIGKLTDYYFFWFNLAVLIYFSMALSVFLFISYILNTKSTSEVTNLWAIHNTFHILYNILIAIGIFKWKTIRK
jgi:hypothetical protein